MEFIRVLFLSPFFATTRSMPLPLVGGTTSSFSIDATLMRLSDARGVPARRSARRRSIALMCGPRQCPFSDIFVHDRTQARLQALRRSTGRSEEHTSELQSLMRTSYAVFCLKKKTKQK